jgi:hypothetical protein
MDNSNNPTIGGMIDGLLGALQNASRPTEATEATNTATFRYSTESVEILVGEVEKTIRQHFEDNAEALGLPSSGNIGIRSEGQPADGDDLPEAGRTYIASVARENKGS